RLCAAGAVDQHHAEFVAGCERFSRHFARDPDHRAGRVAHDRVRCLRALPDGAHCDRADDRSPWAVAAGLRARRLSTFLPLRPVHCIFQWKDCVCLLDATVQPFSAGKAHKSQKLVPRAHQDQGRKPTMSLTSFLDRENTVAKPGFSRWMVPPAALCVHLCIGQAYAFSVFNLPMTKLLGITQSGPGDWKLTELGWIFSLAIFFLGVSSAVFGRWV